MAKVGRNQPCPCGSGRKYKQCCWSADEAAALAAREEQRRHLPPSSIFDNPLLWAPDSDDRLDRLTEISNRTIDLIQAGKLDEAEPLCQQLLEQFPDAPDGHMRLGQLFRVRRDLTTAAHHLRLAAAVARAGDDEPDMALSLEAEADTLDPPAS